MSTDYICHVGDVHSEEVVRLHEHSGELDLAVEDGFGFAEIKRMTPGQVARMAIKMLKAAYYQDEEAVQIAAREGRERYELGIKV